MQKISQKRFFISWDELALLCGTWFKIVNDRMGVRRGETGICPSLEIGIKN